MKTDLLTIPGIGEKMKQHLLNIGYTCVEDLIGEDPEKIFAKIASAKAFLRIAVLFMSTAWPCIFQKIKPMIQKN